MKKLRDIWHEATLFEKLTLLFSLFYVLTPIDFIPEAIFGIFGFFDDATAIGVFVWTIRKILRRLEERLNHESPDKKIIKHRPTSFHNALTNT
jgi:uncharacterized membrane protein YkvA (DUF1232 family)